VNSLYNIHIIKIGKENSNSNVNWAVAPKNSINHTGGKDQCG